MFSRLFLRSPTRSVLRRALTTGKPQPPTKTVIDDAVRQRVAKNMASDGHSATDAAAAASEGDLAANIVLGTLGCASLYGMYRWARPLEQEDEEITGAPWYTRWMKRAQRRTLLTYKGIVDPTTNRLLPDAFPEGHPMWRPYTLCVELEQMLVYSHWVFEMND